MKYQHILKMAIQSGALYSLLILTVQLLFYSHIIECRPDPKPGFLGGVLGGAVGSMIGKTISDHAGHHHQSHNVQQTTIERRETYSNGCYKQVVKEPNISNPGTFIETEQMICPPGVSAPVVNVVPQHTSVPMVGVMSTQPQVTTMYQTNPQMGVATTTGNQPQVMVLSRRTGTYGNSGSCMTKISLLSVISLVLPIIFM
ncbi:uncharacterized protein [Musca autumnalis]|uniref:uncharacterized protein n=1 Tax=Musca autumnalis TaxID=221902 RepID=UPI003CF7C30E